MIQLIGFKEQPFSQILWERDGQFQAKTVCYSKEDELRALARLHDPNDFYNQYDKAFVVRSEDNQFEVSKAA
jgi:hypothetical protein